MKIFVTSWLIAFCLMTAYENGAAAWTYWTSIAICAVLCSVIVISRYITVSSVSERYCRKKRERGLL